MKFCRRIQYADCIVFMAETRIPMYYDWFSEALQQEFEPLQLLKESERGTVTLIRHRASHQ